MPLFSRRRFVWAALAAGGGGVAAAAWLSRSAHNGRAEGDAGGLQVVTRTAFALGAESSITVAHADRELAERAVADAFRELCLVDELMSLYRPDSPLCRLNRRGTLDAPHPYLVDVLRAAGRVSQQSQGAFDVTVQPLWELYAAAQSERETPAADEIESVRQRVDWRRVAVSPARVTLHDKSTAVTLNGIAQGFAADRVASVLRRHGVTHALVNTGELASLGARPDGQPWAVGVQHPRHDDAYLAVAKLRGRCLATSGDYATDFSADRGEHHIFDPATGHSPQALCSVSVAAATATAADALSTAVMVLGPERGLALVRRTPAADALLVLKDGRTLATDGFPWEA